MKKLTFLLFAFFIQVQVHAQIDSTACLYFDGINDRVTSSGAVLDNIGTCDFTFEAWIKPENISPNGFYAILSNRTTDGTMFFLHGATCCGSSTQMLSLRINGLNYLIPNNGTYSGNISDNDCKHVAVSKSKDILSFYINGNLIGTRVINTSSAYPTISTGGSLKIGFDDVSSLPFKGSISDVKIWNTARTKDEIAMDMMEGLPATRDDLSAFWRLNDNSGQTIIDYSDYSNDAYLGTNSSVESSDPDFTGFCCSDAPLENCPTSIIHEEDFSLGNNEYKASLYVESKATVQSTENVTYTAGEYIRLDEGFSSQGELSIEIDGCEDGNSSPINLTAPAYNTLVQDNDITFKWDLDVNSILFSFDNNLNYQLKILEVGDAISIDEVVSNNVVVFTDDFVLPQSPAQEKSYSGLPLVSNQTYLWQVCYVDGAGNLSQSQWSYFDYFEFPFRIDDDPCKSDCPLLRKNSFNNNPQNYWTSNGNIPASYNPTLPGCEDDGYVEMTAWDDLLFSRITQPTLHTLSQGSYYQLAMCVQVPNVNATRIRAFAFNGNPSVFEPGPDVALIGVTSFLPASNSEWMKIQLPVWEANKDFDYIAIQTEWNPDNPQQGNSIYVDNVCLGEVAERYETPDYGFTYDSCGTVIYPDWLSDLIANEGLVVTETEDSIEINRGRVVDLYGHKYDLSTDLWYTEGAPFDHNVGGGITDFTKYDSLYNSLDSNNVLNSAIIDIIGDYVDAVASNLAFSDLVAGNSTAPVDPVVDPTAECLYFDGMDDFVKINSTSPISDIGETDFTLEMTIKPDALQNVPSPVLFSNFRHVCGGDPSFPICIETGFKVMLYDNPSISSFKMLAFQIPRLGNTTPSTTPQYYVPNNGGAGDLLDDCHQITITRQGTALQFYVDGVNIGTFTLPPSSIIPPVSFWSTALPILGNDTDLSRPFAGNISDFRIWNRVRTNTEIIANTDPRRRYSYLEPDLLVNFELLDIRYQVFHSNAILPLTATLGSDDFIGADDPVPLSCNCPYGVCDFQEDLSKPFGGRDIVYVHGLNLDHIFLPFNSPPYFTETWPTDKEAFYTGYFKGRAYSTWKEHIQRELGDLITPSNNYLVAAYPCGQRLEVGINAVVTQIKDAIETGRGVVWSNPNPECRQTFGKEIVIVSHSTGGLLTSTLLGLGEMSDPTSASYDSNVLNSQGNFKNITDRVKAHISFNGALSGSPLARAALLLSNSHVGSVAAAFEDMAGDAIRKADQEMCDWHFSPDNPGNYLSCNDPSAPYCDFNFSFCPNIGGALNILGALNPTWANNTVLMDLEPIVANKWGNATYGNATCKTVTAASTFSGIPQNSTATEALISKFIIEGLDDGVLMMDCQCARKKIFPFTKPSKFLVRPNLVARNFDMGNPAFLKAANLYAEMKTPVPILASPFAGNSCTSGKTTTGMLTWLLAQDNHPRWPNHFSFIQGAGYHYEAWDLGGNGADYYNSWFGNATTYEESLGITNSAIHNNVSGTITPLVHSDIRNEEIELVRKKTIGFNLFGRYFEIPIWKRTYHLLDNYQNEDMVSYVYDYVLKR